MKHYYENVPGLGNVAVSRHAQSQMLEVGISQEAFDRALRDQYACRSLVHLYLFAQQRAAFLPSG